MHERDGIRLMEYLDGTLSAVERQDVEAWLAVDAEARRTLAEHRALWTLLDAADTAPAADTSEEFRRRTLERAREPAFTSWKPRAVALIAASVLVGVVVFAWHDAASHSTLAAEDVAVVGNLDLLEDLDFLEQHADVLDASVLAGVLREFPAAEAPKGAVLAPSDVPAERRADLPADLPADLAEPR